MFKVIKTETKPQVNYQDIYTRLFDSTLSKYNNGDDKKTIKRLSYYGVKAVNEISKNDLNYEQMLKLFELSEVVKIAISLLTPNELITVFPIDKKYDGNKYQVKDYFFTMNELQKIGMNNIIMNRIDELLWDYENMDINMFLVNNMSILSDLNKMKTGKSLMEMWAEENGINTYKLCEDKSIGKKYLHNTKTGKTVAIRSKLPRYLKIIK